MDTSYIYRPYTVRTAAVLTNAYVAGTETIDARDCNRVVLYISYTGGSLTNADIKLSFSYDNTNFYQESIGAFATGTTTEYETVHRLTSDGTFRLSIPIMDRYVKVEVIGNGTVAGSSMSIMGYVGIN